MIDNKVRGTIDYFLDDQELLQVLFQVLERLAQSYGFKKLITPTFEFTNLFSFKKTLGYDIQNNEMFTFLDQKGRSISLKPEGTLSTIRFLLENNKIHTKNSESKIFYIDKMFRYERPQRGRHREFFQFGIEWFGSAGLESNIQVIQFVEDILNLLKIKEYVFEINYIGTSDTRKKYISDLKKYFDKNLIKLSEDSVNKFKSNNIFRILDSKNKSDVSLINGSPKIFDYLSDFEKEEFNNIKKNLKSLKIKFSENSNLVRGMDYYEGFVFEVKSKSMGLGAQDTIIGGGRYDNLINKFDDRLNISAIGFALGIERILLIAKDYLKTLLVKKTKCIIVPISEYYSIISLELVRKLRNTEIITQIDFSTKSLSKKILKWSRREFDFMIILGSETEENKVVFKNLIKKEEKKIKIEKILEEIKNGNK